MLVHIYMLYIKHSSFFQLIHFSKNMCFLQIGSVRYTARSREKMHKDNNKFKILSTPDTIGSHFQVIANQIAHTQ